MYRLRVLCAVTILQLTSTSGSPSVDHHQLELKQHYEHLAYIAHFKCHHPQPRVLSVHHLFPEHETHAKAFFPDVTVLYRCEDTTGCCTSGHHCGPTVKEHVSLPFKATYLQDIKEHKRGSWAMEYHSFENHTECMCSEHHPDTHYAQHQEHQHIHHSPSPVVPHHQEHHHSQVVGSVPQHHEDTHSVHAHQVKPVDNWYEPPSKLTDSVHPEDTCKEDYEPTKIGEIGL